MRVRPGRSEFYTAVFSKAVFFNKALVLVLLLLGSNLVYAEKLKVAVAANFTAVAKDIAQMFESQYGKKVTLSFGSTGKLFAQISYGAPYHIFLAADSERPAKLVSSGNAVKGSQFTYAVGKIVLYSSDVILPDLLTQGPSQGPAESLTKEQMAQITELLRGGKIAMANPKTAPYGQAAQQALSKLGLSGQQNISLVYGENIAQTFQFVATGNVRFGFVALSQVIANPDNRYWRVPVDYYEPLRQDAVLLNNGAANEDAQLFLQFLKSSEVAAIIRKHGYAIN